MAENAASARRQAHLSDRSAVWRRICSALVMVPVALLAVWFGSPWVVLLTAISAGVMAWEWGRLVGRLRTKSDGWLLAGIGAISVLVAGFLSAQTGLALAFLGIVLQQSLAPDRRPLWAMGGFAWIIAASIAFVWLRGQPAGGLETSLWLLAVVWAVDSFAYLAGSQLGGPKLAPRISPNKTWSGLIAGVLSAAVTGGITGEIGGLRHWWPLAPISGGLAIVAQIGDIAESYAKRRFGVKDTGQLIPGHGGLLDRLDGMLAAVVVVVLFELITGESVLIWR